MKEIIPSDSKYIPITQQKWCCVPACIQMIMLRHGLKLIPAELIGYELGLIVPKEDSELFWNPRIGSRPNAGFGTQIQIDEFSINNAFKRLNMPLSVLYKLIGQFDSVDDLREFFNRINENLDYLICFDWKELFDEEYSGGHVCVLDKVDLERDILRIIDPEYESPKWREVTIEKMYKAMKAHGAKNSAGFWVFEKTL
jgi:hypothetical protein